MLLNTDLYSDPEIMGELKRRILELQNDIAVVEGSQLVQRQLSDLSHSPQLQRLVSHVDSSLQCPIRDGFYARLMQLSLDELAFVSISFPERRLKRIQGNHKACNARIHAAATFRARHCEYKEKSLLQDLRPPGCCIVRRVSAIIGLAHHFLHPRSPTQQTSSTDPDFIQDVMLPPSLPYATA
ncbi:uncharacterized protein TrAtP1_004083 [Trichoderma atroviride]|uniref:Uncharacterized protein n=1 Tax=Hypocrea atroviridis (strain ATCC 20476 / IMI 206040) TaxID=452589 RepID=G9P768_HYPAI|nr:uncharacterized protein TRIATDRAFT_321032 [Trichoderma atroviride IMI 206040]EHK40740.1 hypothetical protein TRIATDRAFT_321032 [Trichoderma atroviride IMI 206040]UKZ62849.1 hypothetical protein TrAtP1_004083 [Trichoderma atroviride]